MQLSNFACAGFVSVYSLVGRPHGWAFAWWATESEKLLAWQKHLLVPDTEQWFFGALHVTANSEWNGSRGNFVRDSLLLIGWK